MEDKSLIDYYDHCWEIHSKKINGFIEKLNIQQNQTAIYVFIENGDDQLREMRGQRDHINLRGHVADVFGQNGIPLAKTIDLDEETKPRWLYIGDYELVEFKVVNKHKFPIVKKKDGN